MPPLLPNIQSPQDLKGLSVPELNQLAAEIRQAICSVVAHKGYPYQAAYAASKHALYGFSKVIANELYKENVRVHVICPGGVYTEMVKETRPDLDATGLMVPEDIADLVLYFLEHRNTNGVVDEISIHRPGKEPFA